MNDREPDPDRDQPHVVKAHAIGAVACPLCMGVHIDFTDTDGRVVATGMLNFEQWEDMTGIIERGIEEIVLSATGT